MHKHQADSWVKTEKSQVLSKEGSLKSPYWKADDRQVNSWVKPDFTESRPCHSLSKGGKSQVKTDKFQIPSKGDKS